MFWRRNQRDHDLDRELRSHLESEAEEQTANGVSPKEARYAARRALGNTTLIKEVTREMWAWTPPERLWQDVRYASRLLRKNPKFAAVAIATLAIGIGTNTAIFSVLDVVLLRPLPYPDSKRLLRIWQDEPKMGEGHFGAAPPEFIAYRDRTRMFSSVAGYQQDSFDFTNEGQAEHISACRITASLFQTLRIQPLLGRAFSLQEEFPSAAKVVVLSYRFWRSHYAESPDILGKIIRLNEQPYEIVGVMPREFTFPATVATPGEPPALWVPLSFTSDQLNDWASSFDTKIIARLLPDVSMLQAADDVRRVAAQFQQEHSNIYSGNVRLAAGIEPWAPDFSGSARAVLSMLSVAVAFVLLIACANIANLLLARAGVRQREIAIRCALGASTSRLTRQVLTETAILTIAGGMAGCGLAYALLRLLNSVSISELNLGAARLDIRTLLFTFTLCGITCLLCSVAPGWLFRKPGVYDALKQSARQVGLSRTNRRFARSLIVGEIAACVVLLIGSGLLLRSFVRVLKVPLGFDPGQTLIVRTTLNRQRYSPDRRHALERTIEARLSSLPGVSAVALTTHVPLADERQIGFLIDGRPPDEYHWADNTLVSANYFRLMKIPLLRGRTFSDANRVEAPLAALINQAMAEQYWPGQDPVGKGFKWGGRHLTVIGVAGDVHIEALDKPVQPTIYNSVYQIESGASTSGVFLIRTQTEGDPMRFAPSVQSAIWSADKGLPILGVGSLVRVVSSSLAIRRISLALVGGFAVMALLLSLIGIYGVLSYAVAQRVQEMGVRLALGARPAEITNLVVREGMQLAVAGVLLGVIAGVLAARYTSKLLFDVQPLDPPSFIAGIVLIFAAALCASYLPGRRASRVDPMSALKYE